MALCPFATYRPVRSYSSNLKAHKGLVLHVQVGNGSPYGWFSNRANQASSHFWISKTGKLEQFVDTDLAAWTEASGNSAWAAVETEGFPTESLTDAQVNTLAKLYAWGNKTHGWPFQITDSVNGTGFGTHGMGGIQWGGHTGCPGDLRKAQRANILSIAQGATPAPPTPVANTESVYIIVPCSTGGYWELKRADGGIANRNGAPFFGAMPGNAEVVSPLVGITECKRNGSVTGYWVYDEQGHVYAFGGAPYYTGYAAHTEWHSPNSRVIGLVQTAGFYWPATIRYAQIREQLGDADYVVDTYDIGPELKDK
jgi:hypothetical protein